ncbi:MULTISPECIES: hypothetical protein [Rhizobium]|uniref:hypothetical protein n=1 Tax=Rhizobium TaxID=379 RepID=UPI00195BBB77|nr:MULTISPECIES: hypothetical protein [Rhizobium]MBM7044719.1 hypothetical protein [Rhizobium lusitanum]
MAISERLAVIAQNVQRAVPSASFSDDQPFKLTSVAFTQPDDEAQQVTILDALRSMSATVTVNNL